MDGETDRRGAMQALARDAAARILGGQQDGLPLDPRDPDFASEYIVECDRRLRATPALLQNALENAGHAAEGTNIDPFQGVVEVMQNADDRRASEMRLTLREGPQGLQMLLVHDGAPVEYAHVLAMLLPFVSTKRNDPDQRGRFGIGPKTLRRIASDIEVHCTPYHFGSGEGVGVVEREPEAAVEDFYDPASDTLLVLQLEDDFDSSEFASWISAWDDDGLIFLEHLRRVVAATDAAQPLVRQTLSTRWKTVPSESEVISTLERRSVRAGSRRYDVYRAVLIVPEGQTRFHKGTGATTALSIAACGVEQSAGLFIGFRTRLATRFSIAIDAQFDPTASREGIQDNPWNAWLLTQLGSGLIARRAR